MIAFDVWGAWPSTKLSSAADEIDSNAARSDVEATMEELGFRLETTRFAGGRFWSIEPGLPAMPPRIYTTWDDFSLLLNERCEREGCVVVFAGRSDEVSVAGLGFKHVYRHLFVFADDRLIGRTSEASEWAWLK